MGAAGIYNTGLKAFHKLEDVQVADELGRDVLSRVLIAVQASMKVAVISVTFAAVLGVTLGVLAGYRGGWLDTVVMRVVTRYSAGG